MEMSLPEVMDRYSILKLKCERLDPLGFREELEAYEAAIREFQARGMEVQPAWIEELLRINAEIWDLEADIRRGKEGELGLEEVGRRAIAIRHVNRRRIALKNLIAQTTGSGFIDRKLDHVSQEPAGPAP